MFYILNFLKIQFKNIFHFVLWLLNGLFWRASRYIDLSVTYKREMHILQVVLHVGFHKQAQSTCEVREGKE